jgi:type IV secretory pathway TrbD component
MRANRVYKVMNRPLTILGAARRLFFVALLSGAGVFNLLHSLVGGILLFIVSLIAAQQATKYDTEILRVLLNSAKFKPRYDPMKWEPTEVRIRRNV